MNMRRAASATVFLAAALAAQGCVMVLPSPPIRLNAVSAETLAQLKPGKTTRVDVLMALGDPSKRLDGDRVFFYDWQEVHWVGAVGVPGGGEPFALGDTHRLAIEFSADGTIARLQRLSSYSMPELEEKSGAWAKQRVEGTAK
jgi:outer membrane protein assembly factor BamE (lipoprotein component of BamABCDE complex)